MYRSDVKLASSMRFSSHPLFTGDVVQLIDSYLNLTPMEVACVYDQPNALYSRPFRNRHVEQAIWFESMEVLKVMYKFSPVRVRQFAIIAAIYGRQRVIQWILGLGLNQQVFRVLQYEISLKAASYGHVEILRMLKTRYIAQDALWRAASNGHEAAVQFIESKSRRPKTTRNA